MSSHLRHCPKHKKPLPCAHCALAAKPVQAESITPESAAEPAPKCAACGEPSKTEFCYRKECLVARRRDEKRDTEDYEAKIEKSVTQQEVRELREIGQRRQTTKPTGPLKSVVLPAVPTNNPAAPYGYDDNDRPIGEVVGKPYVPPVKTGTVEPRPALCVCGQQMCGYCHPENRRQTEVLASITRKPEPPNLEDQLNAMMEHTRTMLGIPFITRSSHTKHKTMDYFPEMLSITRGELIGLLDEEIGVEPRTVRKKMLKSRADIDRKIAMLSLIPNQVTKRKCLIRKSEELIESWSVRVMKLRRQQEDILDKSTREKFKRKENRRIDRSEKKITELHRALSELNALQNRAAAWSSNPDDYVSMSAIDGNSPVLFRDRFKTNDDDHDIESYIAFLNQYSMLTDSSRRFQRFAEVDDWRYFENELVLQGIGWRLIRPSKLFFVKYPQLAKYLHDAPVADDGEDEPDETENVLIIKTKGAQIGGEITSAGHRGGGQRPLESFDKTKRYGGQRRGGDYGGEKSDNVYGGLDSGDLDERGGDE